MQLNPYLNIVVTLACQIHKFTATKQLIVIHLHEKQATPLSCRIFSFTMIHPNPILLTCSKLALSNDSFFKSKLFKKIYIIKVSNSLDPDEDQCTFSPDLTPNCLYSGRQNLPLAVLFNTMDCEASDLTMWMCSLI